MKMSYRGVDYDYQPTQIKVGGTINVVKFRGHTYKVDYDYQPMSYSSREANCTNFWKDKSLVLQLKYNQVSFTK